MGGRSYTGETMLRVKFDWNTDTWWEESSANRAKEYLRSFVGSVYTGKSWERLDQDGRQELEELELAPQNLNALYRRDMPVSFIDSPGTYTLSVENLGANPRCVYIPVTLESSEEELARQGIGIVDGSYAKSGSLLSGTKAYSLKGTGYVYPGEGGSSYFDRVSAYASFLEYGPRQFVFLENYGDLTETFGGVGGVLVDQNDDGPYRLCNVEDFSLWSYMVDNLRAQKDAGGEGWTEDLWTMPEEITSLFSQEAKDLLPQAEAYNRFVYQHYTQVPEELEEFLDLFRETYHLSSNWEEYNPDTKVEAELLFMMAIRRHRPGIRILWSSSWTSPTRATASILPQRRCCCSAPPGTLPGMPRDMRCPRDRRAGWTYRTITPTPGWRYTAGAWDGFR